MSSVAVSVGGSGDWYRKKPTERETEIFLRNNLFININVSVK